MLSHGTYTEVMREGSLLVYFVMEEVTRLGPLMKRFYWYEPGRSRSMGPYLTFEALIEDYKVIKQHETSLHPQREMQELQRKEGDAEHGKS